MDSVLFVFTDMTERDELEHTLRQSQKMEVVGQLAGGVAHDFNNMLQAISGFANLAKDPNMSAEERQACLNEVLEASNRAAEITQQLLAFGRRQATEKKALKLDGMVQNFSKFLERLIGDHVNLQVSIQGAIPPIEADKTQLEQILMNLCINSRDAMKEGGDIRIHVTERDLDQDFVQTRPWARVGNFVELRVTDNGSGIPPEMLELIFEPFYTTKPREKGTGLGLSVVYGIVQKHDGFIRVDSTPGEGTRFSIFFPVSEIEPAPAKPALEEEISNGQGSILIAEDEPIVRNLIERVLRQAGYQIFVATDGVEAIELFQAHAPQIDLLIFDAKMPNMGGLEAYRVIQRMAPNIPFILSSGFSEEVARGGMSIPPWGALIQKPYTPNTLLQTVRDHLSRTTRSSEKTGLN